MKMKINNRHFLSAIIIFFYLIPLFFFVSYSIGLMSRYKSWSVLSIGLLLTVFSALTLIFLLYYWERLLGEQFQNKKSILALSNELKNLNDDKVNKVTSLDAHISLDESINHIPNENKEEKSLLQANLKEVQDKYARLLEEMQIKSQELRQWEEEKKQGMAKAEQISQDFSDYKIFSEEQLKQKNLQILTFQRTIEEQRTEMEKHQDQIQLLDTKVHDLSYEIKTLLYLNEAESPAPKQASLFPLNELIKINQIGLISENTSKETIQMTAVATAEGERESTSKPESQIKTPMEASMLLKRCINIAQKLTGANYYGNEASRYRELSSPYFTIDQRRLFDSLRGETGGLIVVYSQKDNKLLFVNNQTKLLLGWSPEKFIQDFPMIIQEGSAEWKRALGILTNYPETQTRLLIKTKSGQELLLNCHMGNIPTGLFRNYVIGVLYPA
jgi:hypothetical protein